MNILGINAYHPDASVALIKDGEVLWAAEEERFNRIKHSSGFPKIALAHCLKDMKLNLEQIDAVAISKDPKANLWRKMVFTLTARPALNLVKNRFRALTKAQRFHQDMVRALGLSEFPANTEIFHVEHHLAHVASAYYLSGFEEAAFLSIDGLGDFSSAMWGVAKGEKIEVLDRIYFPHSAGFLYTAGTQFLGFLNFGDEYKMMGLAGYGKPIYKDQIRKMVKFKSEGKFELDLNYFVHHRGQNNLRWEEVRPSQDILFSSEWDKVLGPRRKPDDPVTERDKNIASSLQAILEEIYDHVLNHLYAKTKQKNLTLAGGVAYNGVANGKITRHTPFKNIYIQGAAGDAGTALGAALYVYHQKASEPKRSVMMNALYGPAATDASILQTIQTAGLEIHKIPTDVLLQKTAHALAEGKVVGWFQGAMEFGPRALGNRSILADPRRTDMQEILNVRVKHREKFRPFAPAVIEEKAKEYFEMDCDSAPFMIKVFPVREEKKSKIPAVTHVDGTARVQTVSKGHHPLFWKLLKAFEAETGVPILLNTSFNENEPVVCTPQEALDCFLRTQMDILVMENYFLERGNL